MCMRYGIVFNECDKKPQVKSPRHMNFMCLNFKCNRWLQIATRQQPATKKERLSTFGLPLEHCLLNWCSSIQIHVQYHFYIIIVTCSHREAGMMITDGLVLIWFQYNRNHHVVMILWDAMRVSGVPQITRITTFLTYSMRYSGRLVTCAAHRTNGARKMCHTRSLTVAVGNKGEWLISACQPIVTLRG